MEAALKLNMAEVGWGGGEGGCCFLDGVEGDRRLSAAPRCTPPPLGTLAVAEVHVHPPPPPHHPAPLASLFDTRSLRGTTCSPPLSTLLLTGHPTIPLSSHPPT